MSNESPARGNRRSGQWLTVGGVSAIAAMLGAVVAIAVAIAASGLLDRKPYEVVLVMDVSSSMRCLVKSTGEDCPPNYPEDSNPGERRIQGALRGVDDALDGFKSSELGWKEADGLAVWTMPTKAGYRDNVTPFPGREEVERQLEGVGEDIGGRTPLYDTIGEGIEHLRNHWRGDGVNALVVVTDGEDKPSEVDEVDLIRKQRQLNGRLLREKEKYKDKPVYLLVTAAYDVGCDHMLDKVTAVKHWCFEVEPGGNTQSAVNGMRDRLQKLGAEGWFNLGASSPGP